MALHQFPDATGKAFISRLADLQPKAAQDPAQAVLDILTLGLNQLACCQHRPNFLRIHRLAMHRPEPTQPHQLRNAAGIVAVRLHRHRFERLAHMPRLQKLNRQPRFPYRRIKPLRQRPRFQPDPAQSVVQRLEPADQRSRIAGHLGLPKNFAGPIHNAYARVFQ